MCAINGVIDFSKKQNDITLRSIVNKMNEKVLYRGPDDEGLYCGKHFAMGMRRLAIIDLSAGNQPLYNENKTIAIVYNGEIYNFQELRNELTGKHQFATNSDTEVIIHAYEEWGMEAFDRLDGMFAFSIYDSRENSIIIVRDRIGEKPLYYFNNGDMFIYGSELKSLLCTGYIQKKINKTALNQYLQFTYVPAPLSIFENVYKLLPGHWLKVSLDGKVVEGEYWNLRSIKRDESISYENACEKLYKLLEQSIKERAISDVPLGAFLSGGIDSSIIVGMLSMVVDKPVNTFTIGYNVKEYDEKKRARRVAEKYKTNHHEYNLNYYDVLCSIDDIVCQLDEPFADPSVLPSWFLCKFTKEYVTVALSGDAGDELFLGYDKYLIDYYSNKFYSLPRVVRSIVKRLILILPDKSTLSRKARKVINNSGKDSYQKRLELMSRAFKGEERSRLLVPEYIDDTCTNIVFDKYNTLKNVTDLKKTQYTDISLVLEGDMIAKMDRMSMLNSLEVRVPFLSKKIIELAFSMPEEYKLKGKNKKRILKDTFRSLFPKGFEKLPKMGFGIPLDHWFRDELRDSVESILNKEAIEKQNIFKWNYVEKILKEHYAGIMNNGDKIWTLIVFQKWYIRYFADKNECI